MSAAAEGRAGNAGPDDARPPAEGVPPSRAGGSAADHVGPGPAGAGPADLGPVPPGYGPSALATPANALTVLRLLVSPLLFVRIVDQGPTWANLGLWTVLAGTDFVDGWVARRYGTTRSGAFLDPLADKVLVLGALFALVEIGTFGWLPVLLITGREIFISLLRVRYGRRGLAVPARRTAKVKTLLQSVAVGLALVPPPVDEPWLAVGVLWASVVMALVSAGQYVADGARAATAMER